MKLVLSRKGFDSTYGGGASPVIDGKWVISLPIEYGKFERIRRYNDLQFQGKNLGELIERLHPHRKRLDFCHLDPDLRRDIVPHRSSSDEWRPLFGQARADASHLTNTHGITKGDLFLFFGLFRHSNDWNPFLSSAREFHMLHGWLQVDEVILNPHEWAERPENHWAREHPHTYGDWTKGVPNVLFVGKRELDIPKVSGRSAKRIPGAGCFQDFDERLVLSDLGNRLKSIWRLPACIKPDEASGKRISRLQNATWTIADDPNVVVMAPGKITLWQEAVISGNHDAINWAYRLIEALGACDS